MDYLVPRLGKHTLVVNSEYRQLKSCIALLHLKSECFCPPHVLYYSVCKYKSTQR